MTTSPRALPDPVTVSLNDRTFAGVSNAPTGQVGSSTGFRHHQGGQVVWAQYDSG